MAEAQPWDEYENLQWMSGGIATFFDLFTPIPHTVPRARVCEMHYNYH